MRRIALLSHRMSCVFSCAENYRLLPFNHSLLSTMEFRSMPRCAGGVFGITHRIVLAVACSNARSFHAPSGLTKARENLTIESE